MPQADLCFSLVFFIVLTSALLQGTSIPLAAQQLGVERNEVRPDGTGVLSNGQWIGITAESKREENTRMAWVYLIVAGFFEIGWATGLKYTEGFTRLWPSLWTAASMALSVWLLAVALKTIPVGTGYAVWTGIGAAGTALAGMVLFGESREFIRIASIVVILAGILGLKLSTP